MVRVQVLGSASGVPVAHRAHASFILEVGGEIFLFDAGEGCSSSLVRYGVDHRRLSTVFISHCHPDHCTGLPMLLQMFFLHGRTAPLRVYLPSEAIDGFREFLYTVYLFPEKLPYPLELLPIRPNPVHRGRQVEVLAFPNDHLKGYQDLVRRGYPHNRLECYSFVILAEGKRMVYSGDISSPGDLSPFMDHPDLLLMEITHSEPEEVFDFLAQVGGPRTLLVHIPPPLEGREDYLRQLALKFGIEDLTIARDGLELVF